MTEEPKSPTAPDESERLNEEESLKIAFVENNINRLAAIFDVQIKKAMEALADLTAQDETVPLTNEEQRYKTTLVGRIKLLGDYQLMIKRIIEKFKIEDPINIDFCNHLIDIITNHPSGTMNEQISTFVADFKQAWQERRQFEKTGIDNREVSLSANRTAHIRNDPLNKHFSITFTPPVTTRENRAGLLVSDDLNDADYAALTDELRVLRGVTGTLFEHFVQTVRIGALAESNPAHNLETLYRAQADLRNTFTLLHTYTSSTPELTLILDAMMRLNMAALEEILVPENARGKN